MSPSWAAGVFVKIDNAEHGAVVRDSQGREFEISSVPGQV